MGLFEKTGIPVASGFDLQSKQHLDSRHSVKDIAEIIKEKVELAVKSAKAEMIKGTTPSAQMGNGTADGKNEKSDFQKYQESKTKTNNEVKLR